MLIVNILFSLSTLWAALPGSVLLIEKNIIKDKIIDYQSGNKIVLIRDSHCEGCDFSKLDGEIRAQFKKSGILLMTYNSLQDFEVAKQLNHRKSPLLKTFLVKSYSSWPKLDLTETGVYFLKNGKPIYRVKGWPGKDNLAEIKHGLKMIR